VLPRTASSLTAVSANRTTNSSNAVVISSKSKISNQESNRHQPEAGRSHGFLEEDEREERKAALSSPIKGGKRLSSAVKYRSVYLNHFLTIILQAIVKLEHTTPPPTDKRVVTGRKEKFTNAHLPRGSQDNGAWRRIFIPTYLQYLASRDSEKDIWTINDDEAIPIQQKIWDFIYGESVPHIITVQGPVFALVSSHSPSQ
jgi:hypothetical protein